jgi:hypothetical protein
MAWAHYLIKEEPMLQLVKRPEYVITRSRVSREWNENQVSYLIAASFCIAFAFAYEKGKTGRGSVFVLK